jgi:hypothetical protein
MIIKITLSISMMCMSFALFALGSAHRFDDVFQSPVTFSFIHADSDYILLTTGKHITQPQKGSVILDAKIFQKNLLGIIVHGAHTPAGGLTLNDSSSGTAEYSLLAPNPFGRYRVEIHCRGIGKFAGQETTLVQVLNIPKHERVAANLNVACPVNDAETTLTSPQFVPKVM